MTALTFEGLLESINGKFGIHDIACPLCGPEKRSPSNRVRRVLRVWYVSPGFISFVCARCGEEGFIRDRDELRVDAVTRARVSSELEQHRRAGAAKRLRKALVLWRSHQPLRGTIAETYLREARAYGGPLPPTLGFLPARHRYPPAMIAAFGIPDEPEPGAMILPDSSVRGVHLTRILPDGSDRDRGEKAKIMIGHSKGWPVVLSPPTDGLALIIAEGIESSLSGFDATGLCAWAAGSASRLPALAHAIPNWVECATILADDDVDGRRHAVSLAQAAKERGLEVRFRVFGQREDSAA
jgi:Toprim domain